MTSKAVWGRWFRFVRAVAAAFYPARPRPDGSKCPSPAVLVCRHKDMTGPIRTMIWLPAPARPWVYHVFCDRASCYRQFRDYTLTRRLAWPKPLALVMARLLSVLMPSLLRSMGAIPVHRASTRVATTFRASLDALCRGESLILYPDVDYTSVSSDVGSLYDGFTLLSELYARKTGQALPFVPLAIRGRALHFGEPLYARAGETRKAFALRIRDALQVMGCPCECRPSKTSAPLD